MLSGNKNRFKIKEKEEEKKKEKKKFAVEIMKVPGKPAYSIPFT